MHEQSNTCCSWPVLLMVNAGSVLCYQFFGTIAPMAKGLFVSHVYNVSQIASIPVVSYIQYQPQLCRGDVDVQQHVRGAIFAARLSLLPSMLPVKSEGMIQ